MLTTLINCPNYVGGSFWCYNNMLLTLDHFPKYVGDFVDISYNKLSSLKELPMNFYIGGMFYCPINNITSPYEFSRLFFGTITGGIYTGYDNLNKFLINNKNPHKKDLPRLLSELRKIQL